MISGIKKYIGAVILIIFIGIQFVPVDRSTPPADPYSDFIRVAGPPAEIEVILKNACYDCHSYDTDYPWYGSIAPVSWWIQGHIDHAREEMNFSTWADYSQRRADHKLEEAAELVDAEEMPLPSYTYGHPEARLTDEQRNALTKWFITYREEMNRPPADSTGSGQ